MNSLNDFQSKIGYKFNNISKLKTALTHSSYLNESKNSSHYLCNERMEFLGDSILGLCVAEYLFKNYRDFPEGKMSKLRAMVVCEDTLSDVANSLSLGDYIYMSNGEELTGGRKRKSILSDAMESVIAAVYLDSSFEVAKDFVMKLFTPYINSAIQGKIDTKDSKSALQEYCQSKGKKVHYELTGESGPDHLKVFESTVYIDNESIAKGTGSSKRDSEQSAAKKCLDIIKGN